MIRFLHHTFYHNRDKVGHAIYRQNLGLLRRLTRALGTCVRQSGAQQCMSNPASQDQRAIQRVAGMAPWTTAVRVSG